MISAIQEVRARGARTIVLAEEGDAEVTPYADHMIRLPVVPPCSSRSSPPCRCSSSPASWPRRWATTSTSPATWPSPSPSSDRSPSLVGAASWASRVGVVDDRRRLRRLMLAVEAPTAARTSVRDRLVDLARFEARRCRRPAVHRSRWRAPVRGQGGPGQGSWCPRRTGLARRGDRQPAAPLRDAAAP